MRNFLLIMLLSIILVSCSDPVKPEPEFTDKFMLDSVRTFLLEKSNLKITFLEDEFVVNKISNMYKEQIIYPEYKEFEYMFYDFTFGKMLGEEYMTYGSNPLMSTHTELDGQFIDSLKNHGNTNAIMYRYSRYEGDYSIQVFLYRNKPII